MRFPTKIKTKKNEEVWIDRNIGQSSYDWDICISLSLESFTNAGMTREQMRLVIESVANIFEISVYVEDASINSNLNLRTSYRNKDVMPGFIDCIVEDAISIIAI